MHITKIWIAFALAVLIAGCVRSLHPLFTEKDLIFEPTLVGTWVDGDGKDTWTFQKSKDKSYTLIHFQHEHGKFMEGKETGDTARFEVKLGRLGNFFFLDIYPEEPTIKNDLYKIHLIPAHTFSRMWLEGDELRLSMLDNDWLKKMIAEGKVQITHEKIDGDVILTAPTEELQKLVLKYAEDTKAFPEPGKLHRLK